MPAPTASCDKKIRQNGYIYIVSFKSSPPSQILPTIAIAYIHSKICSVQQEPTSYTSFTRQLSPHQRPPRIVRFTSPSTHKDLDIHTFTNPTIRIHRPQDSLPTVWPVIVFVDIIGAISTWQHINPITSSQPVIWSDLSLSNGTTAQSHLFRRKGLSCREAPLPTSTKLPARTYPEAKTTRMTFLPRLPPSKPHHQPFPHTITRRDVSFRRQSAARHLSMVQVSSRSTTGENSQGGSENNFWARRHTWRRTGLERKR